MLPGIADRADKRCCAGSMGGSQARTHDSGSPEVLAERAIAHARLEVAFLAMYFRVSSLSKLASKLPGFGTALPDVRKLCVFLAFPNVQGRVRLGTPG